MYIHPVGGGGKPFKKVLNSFQLYNNNLFLEDKKTEAIIDVHFSLVLLRYLSESLALDI